MQVLLDRTYEYGYHSIRDVSLKGAGMEKAVRNGVIDAMALASEKRVAMPVQIQPDQFTKLERKLDRVATGLEALAQSLNQQAQSVEQQ